MTTGTLIRTIVLALALLNQILAIFGISPLPISDEQVELLVTTIVTIIVAVITWWKNNSFTRKAIEADNYLKNLKR